VVVNHPWVSRQRGRATPTTRPTMQPGVDVRIEGNPDVVEGPDLDFKEATYGRADNDKKELCDQERRRLRDTIVGNMQPMPSFDVIAVEDPKNAGCGCLVIWVARTAGAPHAYTPKGTGFTIPAVSVHGRCGSRRRKSPRLTG
jgi:hypothetical protein